MLQSMASAIARNKIQTFIQVMILPLREHGVIRVDEVRQGLCVRMNPIVASKPPRRTVIVRLRQLLRTIQTGLNEHHHLSH